MRSPFVLTAILTLSVTVIVLLSSLNTGLEAIIVNNTNFSVNVLGNWAFLNVKLEGAGDYNSSILLIPTEFSDFFMSSNGNFQKLFQKVGASSFMTLDSAYLFRNVPLEIYAQSYINQLSEGKVLSKENTTIDGERALKFHSTYKDKGNLTRIVEGVDYYVFHDGNPYRLSYIASPKDFQKYLPQFEQMVKTFKFAK
jgi:hypothetical protein